MQGVPHLEGELRPLQRASKGERRAAAAGQEAPDPEAMAAPSQADETPVSSIMTRDVVSFTTQMCAEAATRMMLEQGISGAPIIDEDGRPIGMVSKTDLLEALHEVPPEPGDTEAPTAPRVPAVVGDIMVPYLLAVSSRAPIALAAALMAYEGVHRLLVLDETNQMVGIVSSLDVLRWVAQLSGFCLPPRARQQPRV